MKYGNKRISIVMIVAMSFVVLSMYLCACEMIDVLTVKEGEYAQ